MKRSKKMRLFIPLLLLCIAALGFGVLYAHGHRAGEVQALIPYMSLEEKIAAADLVAQGVVTGAEERKIEPVGDRPVRSCVDYQVRLSGIDRGETEADSVTVRVFDGIVTEDGAIDSAAPVFQVGQEVLLLLQRPGMGGYYNTEGDYYYIVNCATGAYARDGEGYRRILVDVEVYDGETASTAEAAALLDEETFAAAVARVNSETPVDSGRIKRDALETMASNLERGSITQEEYDRFLKEITSYATVVEP